MKLQRGLSLMETVLAVTLLGLLVLLVLNLFPGSIATMRSAQARYEASNLARSLLDQRASGSFAQLQFTYGVQALAPVQSNSATLYPCLEVYPVPGTDPQHLKGVRVTVRWSDRGRWRGVVQELWVHGLPN